MTDFVFANNINTTLSAAITAGSTTATIADASKLPSLAGGKTLVLTLLDAATKSNFEVVYCTAISGTTLTIARGQEGTTAQAYGSGDYVWGAPTAGILQTFLQTADYATPTQSLAGSATDVVSNPAGVAAFVEQFGIGKGVSLGNNVDLNDVVTPGIFRVESGTINAPSFGADFCEILVGRSADTVFQIVVSYGSSKMAYRAGNPSQVGGSGTWQQWRVSWDDGNFNPSNCATVSSLSAYSKYTDFLFQNGNPGYAKLPNGFLIQGGQFTELASVGGVVTFPLAFSNLCMAATIMTGGGSNAYVPRINSITKTNFSYGRDNWGSADQSVPKSWIAIGF